MTDSDGDEQLEEFLGEQRHLSVFRIIAVLVTVLAVVGGWIGIQRWTTATPAAAAVTSMFAPYVDVTSTPRYAFEQPVGSAPTDVVLGFIVSDLTAPCEPSWGSFYTLESASGGVDLDRRIARLRQLGGDVTVSFGGAANSELSIGCTDPVQLTAAYRAVVDRYSATSIDLDIEGSASSTPAVAARRATAIAALVRDEAAAGRVLSVWLTLPVAPTGLTAEGLSVLTSMLDAKVELAGVNAMTMDYGQAVPAGQSMADTSELALAALQTQLQAAYQTAGIALSEAGSWHRVSATAMIGQNDVPGEIFSLADAEQLVAFAARHEMPRLSMWSANRDQGCGPNYPDVRVVSDVCSGVSQAGGAYGAIFGGFGAGEPAEAVSIESAPESMAVPAPGDASMVDDPATSPYVIWTAEVPWRRYDKVVWRHNVYEAKWFSLGEPPDAVVGSSFDTPWRLVGPVLPGEKPLATTALSSGTYPEWNEATVYAGGDRVQLDGVGYQAKWWTQGSVPGVTDADGTGDWQLLTS